MLSLQKTMELVWDDTTSHIKKYNDSIVEDSGNSIADTLELLQSCTKPSMYLQVRRGYHINCAGSVNMHLVVTYPPCLTLRTGIHVFYL